MMSKVSCGTVSQKLLMNAKAAPWSEAIRRNRIAERFVALAFSSGKLEYVRFERYGKSSHEQWFRT